MKKIKIIAGIAWAFICLILILILFPGLNSFSTSASKLPFMKINPNFSGGEVAQQFVTESCTLEIRKPVFDGLLRERTKGFVQIGWRGNLPDIIDDTIDFDSDSDPDFHVLIDTRDQKTKLDPLCPEVLDLNISTPVSYGWAIRVNLKKK